MLIYEISGFKGVRHGKSVSYIVYQPNRINAHVYRWLRYRDNGLIC